MSTSLEVSLGVKRRVFRTDGGAELRGPAFKEKRKNILIRDDFKCRGCGFHSKLFQELHHIDDDHSNNEDENLATLCCLCHSCFHLGFVGQKSKAQIIYMPEMSQIDLNTIIRCLWIAERTGERYKDEATLILAILKNRARHAREILKTSSPRVLANRLSELNDKEYSKRSSFLSDFRLLHSPELYQRQIGYWVTETKNNFPEEVWEDLLKEA